MSNYFVFTDEAGTYKHRPSKEHINKHPFYIRSNVLISIDDYRQYQIDMQRIGGEYEIPFDMEIKWSDLWTREKHPRNQFIAKMSEQRLKGYFRKVLKVAADIESLQFVFTVTSIIGGTFYQKESTIYEFHLKNAFQRINMEIKPNDFAVFVMDELNTETIKQIKAACHGFTLKGDFVDYKNLYQGVLTENSLYSPGIQLADYAAGIMNGYLRRKVLSPNNYEFAKDMFEEFIQPKLRHHYIGDTVGYGIIDVPRQPSFRKQLEGIFD